MPLAAPTAIGARCLWVAPLRRVVTALRTTRRAGRAARDATNTSSVSAPQLRRRRSLRAFSRSLALSLSLLLLLPPTLTLSLSLSLRSLSLSARSLSLLECSVRSLLWIVHLPISHAAGSTSTSSEPTSATHAATPNATWPVDAARQRLLARRHRLEHPTSSGSQRHDGMRKLRCHARRRWHLRWGGIRRENAHQHANPHSVAHPA